MPRTVGAYNRIITYKTVKNIKLPDEGEKIILKIHKERRVYKIPYLVLKKYDHFVNLRNLITNRTESYTKVDFLTADITYSLANSNDSLEEDKINKGVKDEI